MVLIKSAIPPGHKKKRNYRYFGQLLACGGRGGGEASPRIALSIALCAVELLLRTCLCAAGTTGSRPFTLLPLTHNVNSELGKQQTDMIAGNRDITDNALAGEFEERDLRE